MGIFSRTPVTAIEGVIDRIGLSSITGSYFSYRFKLVDDKRWFRVESIIGPNRQTNLGVTTAKPGDHVQFGIVDKQYADDANVTVKEFFQNLDINIGQ